MSDPQFEALSNEELAALLRDTPPPPLSGEELDALSKEEREALLDREARRLLGISGKEFMKAYNAMRPQMIALRQHLSELRQQISQEWQRREANFGAADAPDTADAADRFLREQETP